MKDRENIQVDNKMIKCPKCKKDSTPYSRQCQECGTEIREETFAKIKEYYVLKDEAGKIISNATDIADSIGAINRALVELGDRINTELAAELRDKAEGQACAPRLEESATPPIKVQPTGKVVQQVMQPASDEVVTEGSRKVASSDNSVWGEVKIGQTALLIAGIVTMVFGVGFFLKYSFDKGWIGPAGRVALAYAWGAAFLAIGHKLDNKGYETYGRCLIGGAVAVLYFATYAGFQIYGLFPQYIAFVLMAINTAFAAVLAIKYDTQWLAIIALIGGFVTPLLISTGFDNHIVLMTYVLILNVGMLWMAYAKDWSVLYVLALFGTYASYIGWYVRFYASEKFWSSIIYLNLYFVIHSIAPYLHMYEYSRNEKDEGVGDIFVTGIIMNTAITAAFSYKMIDGRYSYEWMSILTIFYAGFFAALSAIVLEKRPWLKTPIAFFLSKAILFVIVTVPLLFSEHIITVFWTALGGMIFWMGARLGDKRILAWAYIVLMFATFKFFFYDYLQVFELSLTDFKFKATYMETLLARWFTGILLCAAIFWCSRVAKSKGSEILKGFGIADSSVLVVAFWSTLFVFANIETAAFFSEYLPGARFAALSVLWSLFASVLMLLGFRYRSKALRNCALVMFLFTALKVFLFDMSKLSTPYRIVSFIILGVIMIGVSYLYHKYKDELEEALAADSAQKKSP